MSVTLYRGKVSKVPLIIGYGYRERVPSGKWYWPSKYVRPRRVHSSVDDRYVHYCESCNSMMVRLGDDAPQPASRR